VGEKNYTETFYIAHILVYKHNVLPLWVPSLSLHVSTSSTGHHQMVMTLGVIAY
jgi:hypothetical protein